MEFKSNKINKIKTKSWNENKKIEIEFKNISGININSK